MNRTAPWKLKAVSNAKDPSKENNIPTAISINFCSQSNCAMLREIAKNPRATNQTLQALVSMLKFMTLQLEKVCKNALHLEKSKKPYQHKHVGTVVEG